MEVFKKVFLPLFMMSFIACGCDAVICPVNCKCIRGWFSTVKSVTCHNISSIPENIPKYTLKLILAGNSIEELRPGIFKGLLSLNEIKLQTNKIRHIGKGVFTDAGHLQYLNISENEIKEIEPESFKGLSYLERIDVTANPITTIQRNTFTGADYLMILYLSRSKIETIEEGAFKGLSSLQIMLLVYNCIKKIQYGMFTGASVRQLDLRENEITSIDKGAFKEQSNLIELYLKSNRIQNIHPGTFRGLRSLELLAITKNNLTALENGVFNDTKKLERLYLSLNQIQVIHPKTLEGLGSLKVLYIDDNRLQSIDTTLFQDLKQLKELILSGNRINTFKLGTFSGLFSLKILHLEDNLVTWLPEGIFNDSKKIISIALQGNRLQYINQGTFKGLVNMLRLNLSRNNIEWIKGDEFLSLRSLIFIDLNRNKIKAIGVEAFKNLQDLNYLYIGYNNLTVLPNGLFNNMKSLRLLNISNNNIKELMPGTFRELTSLRYLHLKGNKIYEIRDGVFNETRHLHHLDLSENAIRIVEKKAFDGLSVLIKLLLQDNELTNIENDVIGNVKFLRLLNVSGNNIEIVENGTFRGLRNAVIIDLSRNKIKHIQQGAFDDCRDLMQLYLEWNQIDQLERNLFDKALNLYYLYLDNNQIKKFKPGTFTSTEVEVIQVDNNKISRVEKGFFANSKRIRALSMSENEIEAIEPGAFRGLATLSNVYLDGNKLTHLDNETLRDAKKLFSLSLTRNRLKYLPDGLFIGLSTLSLVVLHGNELSSIPRFDANPLMHLFFASNNIKSLDNLNFIGISNTISIFLDNNRIVRVPNNTFEGATKLKAITLSGNPLTVIEDGAFLSLPSLEIINLLDTKLTIPLNIWPVKTLVTYIVIQNRNSETEIAIRGQDSLSKSSLEKVGYICKMTSFDWTYDCKPCSRGSFKSPLTRSCEPCPPGGFYQDEKGYSGIASNNLGCKKCPPGSYVKPDLAPGKSQTDCQSCPPGTNLKEHANFRACKCMESYYRLRRFGPCSICTKGYVCLNETVNLAAGFYWVWQRRHSQEQYDTFKKDLIIANGQHKIQNYEGQIPNAYACPVTESCLGKSSSKCKEGYTGTLCAVCDKGYFNVLTKCRECPTLPWIIGQIIIATLAMIVLIAVVLWEKKKDPNNPSRTFTDIFLARLKIVIGFYQVSVATFDSFSYISWPGPVLTIMKYAKMVQFNLLLIAPVHCIDDSMKADAYTQLLLSATISGIIILTGMLFNFLITFYVSYNISNKEDQDVQISQYKAKCYRFLILILFITFPSTCTHIIQMLPAACHEICSYSTSQCNSYLKADYSIKCNTVKHAIYGRFSSVALVYCIGFPIAMFALLKYARRSGESDKNRNAMLLGTRFLYENYSIDCWFWEIVELARKIIVASLLILMDAESRTSLGLTSILSGLYSVTFAYSRPIEDAFEHWLQLTSLMASSVNFTVGMLMKIPKEESSSGIGNQADTLMITVLLVAANVFVIILVAVKYISNVGTTLLALKKDPQCNVTCCLEILQLATEAPGEVSNISPPPTDASQDLFDNVTREEAEDESENNEAVTFTSKKVLK